MVLKFAVTNNAENRSVLGIFYFCGLGLGASSRSLRSLSTGQAGR